MVEYQVVHPSFELQLPDFNVERFYNLPKLDYTDAYNPDYGTKILNDSLYNDLLGTTPTNTLQPNIQTALQSNIASALLSSIQNHLGEIYNNAKRLKSGYSDCSGFVNKVFKDMGIDLGGASSIYMYNRLTDHINYDQVQPGDLVFLTPKQTHSVAGTRRRAGIDSSHVAIVVEKQGTRIKVAENTGHKGRSDFSWYELGGANKPSGNGIINYSKGNKGKNKNELLGFGRIRV